MLATIAYHVEWDKIISGIQKIKEAAARCKYGSVIAGIHMEGPYINPKYGSITANARNPDSDEIKQILKAGEGIIKQRTLSPELPGINVLYS
ncbi:MAG TPA: hypothetical protein GXX20_05490 [Clostridiaceae bacterium]|nr:hypothetical protein [Clostridiaceae bacterium]